MTWYCQTNMAWEPYPPDICQQLEREHQHILQGTSAQGGVIRWKWSKKITYQIDILSLQQENIRTGQLRAVRRTGASNRISMIARHMEGHNSVMIRAAPSEGCRIRWWLPSGSRVFTAMPPDTTEYVLIFPDPSMAHCWDPEWQVLTQWPQPSGYIKTHNLATLERESPLALMDVESGVWSSSRPVKRKQPHPPRAQPY